MHFVISTRDLMFELERFRSVFWFMEGGLWGAVDVVLNFTTNPTREKRDKARVDTLNHFADVLSDHTEFLNRTNSAPHASVLYTDMYLNTANDAIHDAVERYLDQLFSKQPYTVRTAFPIFPGMSTDYLLEVVQYGYPMEARSCAL